MPTTGTRSPAAAARRACTSHAVLDSQPAEHKAAAWTAPAIAEYRRSVREHHVMADDVSEGRSSENV